MKLKKLLSTFAAMAIAATSFAGLGISANAAEQPTEVIATSSAKISSGTITAVDSETQSLYMHYYAKALSEGMVAFALEEGNYYDADHILKAELSTYDWSTAASGKRGRTLNGSLYALSDATLATKTTSGDALWTQTGSISSYLANASNSVDTAENKKIDVTEYMQSLNDNTNAVAFLYTVDTSSVCDWNIATQNVSGKEPKLLLTYGQAVTLTVKLNDTAKANVPVVIDEKTYTTDENGQISFVADAGTYNYTIEQSADYNAKSGSITVSSADVNEDIVLEESTATSCTLTLKYVDADGNQLKTSTAANNAFVGVAYELSETEKADFTYTNDSGIEYTAKVTDTSVTPSEATATCNVTCTLTEKTYNATVTSLPHSKVTISGTSTTNMSVSSVVYTDKTGTATVNTYVGTYKVSVEKTDYTTQTGNLTVNNEGTGTVDVSIAPTTDSVVYYEDFENTGYSSATVGALIGNMRIANGVAYTYNTANSTNSYDLPASTYNSYSINISNLYAQAKGASRTTYISFKNNSKDVFKVTAVGQGTVSETAQRNISVSAGDTSVVLETSSTGDVTLSGNLAVTINADGTITGTWGSKTFELAVDSANVGITSMEVAISGNANVYLSLDDFKITGKTAPVIESVATSSTDVTVAVPSDTQALTAVTSDVDNTTYGAVSEGKILTTVYIKVANPTDGVAPKLTVGGQDYQATYSDVKDYNGYYVYQILSDSAVDLTSYTVTYTGAADKTVSSEA